MLRLRNRTSRLHVPMPFSDLSRRDLLNACQPGENHASPKLGISTGPAGELKEHHHSPAVRNSTHA